MNKRRRFKAKRKRVADAAYLRYYWGANMMAYPEQRVFQMFRESYYRAMAALNAGRN